MFFSPMPDAFRKYRRSFDLLLLLLLHDRSAEFCTRYDLLGKDVTYRPSTANRGTNTAVPAFIYKFHFWPSILEKNEIAWAEFYAIPATILRYACISVDYWSIVVVFVTQPLKRLLVLLVRLLDRYTDHIRSRDLKEILWFSLRN